MGLDLKPILTYTSIKLSDLSNKIIAVDAFNTIHQFLADNSWIYGGTSC